jgi:hypothetical protein
MKVLIIDVVFEPSQNLPGFASLIPLLNSPNCLNSHFILDFSGVLSSPQSYSPPCSSFSYVEMNLSTFPCRTTHPSHSLISRRISCFSAERRGSSEFHLIVGRDVFLRLIHVLFELRPHISRTIVRGLNFITKIPRDPLRSTAAEVRLCCPVLSPVRRESPSCPAVLGVEIGIFSEKRQDLECAFV